MKQVAQNYKTGAIRLQEAGTPTLKPGGVLVRSRFSLISTGTESMKVREGKMSYLGKAMARPDQVKKVLQSVQQQGFAATYQKVMHRIDSLSPLGYSLAGTVVAVGENAREFQEGRSVACAGAGYANHAEVNFIPANLVVPIPDGVSLPHAAFTTVGAIAMQGFRQSGMQMGETACVVGLGLIGQILIQLLKAAGMRAVGIDLSRERCDLAMKLGCDAALEPNDASLAAAVQRFSGGFGADCIFIAAAGPTNEPVEIAARLARDRARVVDIGKVNMDIPWKDYYEKEMDLRFSRSYGPGRYDPNYEERGVDYPIGYVRWTERRNMSAFLDLVAQKKIQLDPLVSAIFPFSEAEQVYQDIADNNVHGIGLLFEYFAEQQPAERTPVIARSNRPAKGTGIAVRLGAIGAGNYAASMLLPVLAKDSSVRLIDVATTNGLSAANASRKFGFERNGTDYAALLKAEDLDAVLIATRHATHPKIAAEALRAGKAVFVEKPLAIDRAGAELVRKAIVESGNERLQVGFNRRFAPLVRAAADVFGNSHGPLAMTYRVHSGQVDRSSWYADASEGSRFAGEAGHFFDVFSFLTGARPVMVYAQVLRPLNPTRDDLENIVAVVNYEDGSVGNLLYLTQGGAKLPKEHLEVFGGGKTVQLENFERLNVYEGVRTRTVKAGVDKGQSAELRAFVDAVKSGGEMPIPVQSLFDTTLVTLAAEESLRLGRAVRLADYWMAEG